MWSVNKNRGIVLLMLVVVLSILLTGCKEKTKPTVIDESNLFEEWESKCVNFREGFTSLFALAS